MTLLPITEDGVEPLLKSILERKKTAKIDAELPPHPPVKVDLGPNKTGVKGNVVKSESGLLWQPHVADLLPSGPMKPINSQR